MTTSDLRAGAVTAWALDRAELVSFAAWAWALAVVAAIVSGSGWIVGMFVLTGFVPAAAAIVKRARDHREAVEFFEWFNAIEPEAQRPETD